MGDGGPDSLHEELLTEGIGEVLRHQPRDYVGRAAGRKSDEHAHRAGRIALRRGRRDTAQQQYGCEQELQNGRENEGFPILASGITSPANFSAADPGLLTVAKKWAALPEAVRAGIVAMVNAAVPDAPRVKHVQSAHRCSP